MFKTKKRNRNDIWKLIILKPDSIFSQHHNFVFYDWNSFIHGLFQDMRICVIDEILSGDDDFL